MPSKWRLPAAALGKTKVEVAKIGGFSEPSDKAGSKPWPIISVEGFNLRPPISSISGLGLRRGVVAGGAASSLVRSGLRSEERRVGKECVRTGRHRWEQV